MTPSTHALCPNAHAGDGDKMLYCDGIDDFAFSELFEMQADWHNTSTASLYGVGAYTVGERERDRERQGEETESEGMRGGRERQRKTEKGTIWTDE